ncbi:Tar-like ligand binding protein [Brevibacterium sanguinis]|uniref:Tar-like ligand binding protein n=2 Tax=Brevibacterium TaxID=1696 RepID=A0A366IIA1_9MICO|nr:MULTISPECIES: HAMP domain-containing protein [Brevibacterium]RBP63585.1 Tar-like ligand binding protein [Brevibacterium sanguinis]RBP70244.1 Tar-like ligand binding protein [Brevibacterium celere]
MTLRRKLFVLFGSLVAMTFLAAGITTWAVINWKTTENDLQRHYERSLKLQSVRALTFQAVLEVPEGLTGNDPDARQDFEETIAPASDALRTWTELVDTAEERQEVETVQKAFDTLVADCHRAFDRIEAGDFAEAERLFDEQIEEASAESFQSVTANAEVTDADRREAIHSDTARTRHTAEVMLIITAISAFCIALLLGAYLVSDVFTPLRDVRRGLAHARRGDRSVRLNEDRHDEFGEVNREFNRFMGVLAEAIPPTASTAGIALESPGRGAAGSPLPDSPAAAVGTAAVGVAPAGRAAPLERAPLRPFVYEVVSRVHSELADQSADLDIAFATSVSHVPVDYLPVQQALSTLIVDTVGRGGRGSRVGLRISDAGAGADRMLAIEVGATRPADADSSAASAPPQPADADDEPEATSRSGNLALTRAVAEQHGGSLVLEDFGDGGSYARLELALDH